jgi:hypothetical protein
VSGAHHSSTTGSTDTGLHLQHLQQKASYNVFLVSHTPKSLSFVFCCRTLWCAMLWRAVLPNGAVTGLDIGFSNASLVHITMSFYTMCKSTTPIFLLAFAFMWGLET